MPTGNRIKFSLISFLPGYFLSCICFQGIFGWGWGFCSRYLLARTWGDSVRKQDRDMRFSALHAIIFLLGQSAPHIAFCDVSKRCIFGSSFSPQIWPYNLEEKMYFCLALQKLIGWCKCMYLTGYLSWNSYHFEYKLKYTYLKNKLVCLEQR